MENRVDASLDPVSRFGGSMAEESKVLVTRRRRTKPTVIGRIHLGLSWMGSRMAAKKGDEINAKVPRWLSV